MTLCGFDTPAPTQATPWAVSDYTVVSALGAGKQSTLAALQAGRTGLARQPFETSNLDTWLGVVAGLDEVTLPSALKHYDCRNNRLAWMALQTDGFAERAKQARRRWGSHRIGIFLGTSTSGILQTEQAYRHRDPISGALPANLRYAETHNTYALADFVRIALHLEGPAAVVSTACSSSAKVFGMASRMMTVGLIDAAIVGGVDTLCMTTLYGFNALELLSPDICRPWDAQRHGLSLGEGAAFALLERNCKTPRAWMLGIGESSDGHHMSSPHPQGAGAADAMRSALRQADLHPEQVDYVNLHGTATPNNDASEDLAMQAVFGNQTPCSSTKGATGHTLGAAGGLEAGIAMLALAHSFMPGGLNLTTPDPTLGSRYLSANQSHTLRVVASNSFGFGGSNTCLIFGAAP
jgi:3-oxoacyl-[acyl-carrier-protein] synthase-1